MSEQNSRPTTIDFHNLSDPEDVESELELVGLYMAIYNRFVLLSLNITKAITSDLDQNRRLGTIAEQTEAPLLRWLDNAATYLPDWFDPNLLDYPNTDAPAVTSEQNSKSTAITAADITQLTYVANENGDYRCEFLHNGLRTASFVERAECYAEEVVDEENPEHIEDVLIRILSKRIAAEAPASAPAPESGAEEEKMFKRGDVVIAQTNMFFAGCSPVTIGTIGIVREVKDGDVYTHFAGQFRAFWALSKDVILGNGHWPVVDPDVAALVAACEHVIESCKTVGVFPFGLENMKDTLAKVKGE